ncbi:hypothetical protein NF556_20625 [Ornithinimicrobium faecis]|uniref:RNA polymerase sigma factor 70 region 4 type 2 domain-containing protein n=1 Tax=Ornithinimicrobium faecis TaxID=2934158 RepID=A0ABY4YT54_9MICO|nr:hypothetical protein [Ornithinimicrobium sp. HY1793]USQ79959.1 hypothetical protein NF556_20625 [Ornithinimicrobium sp. HY1793]
MSVRTWRQQLDELPPTLAVALRLHDAGHPDTVVATALDVPVEGVAALLQVAQAKLAHLAVPASSPATGHNQWSTTEGQDGTGT